MMNATEYRKAIKAALVVALGPDVAKLAWLPGVARACASYWGPTEAAKDRAIASMIQSVDFATRGYDASGGVASFALYRARSGH